MSNAVLTANKATPTRSYVAVAIWLGWVLREAADAHIVSKSGAVPVIPATPRMFHLLTGTARW